MARVEVKDLHFLYSANEEILKGINLYFDDRSTAIIGQNGAGKTTFVKLLKGLLKPSSGEIIINGASTKELTAANLAKSIGLVFQNPNDQIFKNKVIDEVMFGPINIGMDKDKARVKAEDALKLVGLYDEVKSNPYDLGLSERKLISIASIIAMDTDIVIFDEPTIAQDYLGKEKIKNIIKGLRENNKLVMAILHDMDFAAEVFERIIVFNEGRALLDGSTREVFSKADLLREADLEQPHVTQLCGALGVEETFLTVEDFLETYKS